MGVKRAFILTEGSQTMGFGHIARCSALYEGFQEHGIDSTMIVNGDQTTAELLKDKQHKILNWLAQPNLLTNFVDAENDLIFIDSYHITNEAVSQLNNTFKKIAYLDDSARLNYTTPCTVLIATPFAHILNFEQKKEVNYIYGAEFTLLRKDFWEVKEKSINPKIDKVLVTIGGTDVRGISLPIVQLVSQILPNAHIHLMVGRSTLSTLATISDRVTLHHDLNAAQVKNFMLNCDLAISNAGQTLCELARVGTPSIGICIADNQINFLKGFIEAGFVRKFISWDQPDWKERLTDSILYLQPAEERKQVSVKGKNLIDGKGALRVAERLLQIYAK